ncbi:MAG: GNAT family N-acetyltransferase [Ruminococcaceae bacterium]|nr:GNAT family N-acetyltransferase [Oscillospiraceae bacterium]
MIEKITDESGFEGWKNNDIFSVRIMSLLKSYGCKYGFATYYKQIVDGNITAILSKLDGDFTLSITDSADTEELIHFFCVTGYTSITCSDDFTFGARYDEGVTMYCDAKKDYRLSGVTIDEYPKLMDLFNFVDYQSQDFKSWYVDISHRVRHGTAKAYTLCLDDDIIASGILSAITENGAILTAVRCQNEFRGMGYGSTLVAAICNDVACRVHIMRDDGMNEHFYERLGFINNGRWRIYR